MNDNPAFTPHAYLTPWDGHAQPMVFDLGSTSDPAEWKRRWMSLGEEVMPWLDDIALMKMDSRDDRDPWVIVKVLAERNGFAATLPEHGGW